jgi:ATP-dependent DNA helicase RecG
MTIKKLEALVAQGEGQQLEFKRSLAELEIAVRTLVAFANTEGGTVLFGVRESGEIVGVEAGQTGKEQLVNKVTASTDPVLYPSVEFVKVNGKTVIIVTVAESENKPHLAGGRAYKRVGTTTVQLRRDEYERLLLGRRASEYDHPPVEGATWEDVDEDRVRWYLSRRAEKRGLEVPTTPLPNILAGLGALVERDGRLVPTRAGILFFGRDPQAFVPHSEVRIARFQGTTMMHFVDRADLRGTLPEMIDEAERFIRRNTRLAAKVVGFRRREVTEYPYEAVREAVCNAVCHRDYTMTGSVVRVMIFDDRIEVNSPGGLPPGVTLQNIERKHVLRNTLLANFLYDIFYIEKWGAGITKMRRLMREYGLKEPLLEDLGSFFAVTFYGPGDRILDLIPEEGVTDLRALGLNERQIEALRLMINEGKELTNRQYREMFGITDRTALRDLNGLVAVGYVQRVGEGCRMRYIAT